MKYTGRITLLLISITASLSEHILGIESNSYEKLLDCLFAVIAWFVGGLYDKLTFLSNKDALTGNYNRRFIEKVIPRLLYKTKLKKEKLTVFIIDANNFKTLNDTYGHRTGDLVLKSLSSILMSNTRKKDMVARWGGDEFLIITLDTDKDSAQRLVERLNDAIIREAGWAESTYKISLSVSIGFATFPEDASTFDELLSIADKNMYKIKYQNKSPG